LARDDGLVLNQIAHVGVEGTSRPAAGICVGGAVTIDGRRVDGQGWWELVRVWDECLALGGAPWDELDPRAGGWPALGNSARPCKWGIAASAVAQPVWCCDNTADDGNPLANLRSADVSQLGSPTYRLDGFAEPGDRRGRSESRQLPVEPLAQVPGWTRMCGD